MLSFSGSNQFTGRHISSQWRANW